MVTMTLQQLIEAKTKELARCVDYEVWGHQMIGDREVEAIQSALLSVAREAYRRGASTGIAELLKEGRVNEERFIDEALAGEGIGE